jgi:hypothetical protein
MIPVKKRLSPFKQAVMICSCSSVSTFLSLPEFFFTLQTLKAFLNCFCGEDGFSCFLYISIVEVILFTVTEKNHKIFSDRSFSINAVAEYNRAYFTALPAVLR